MTGGDGLQSSDSWFRLFVDAIQEYAIFMLDPEGRVVTWNPGAERIKGYRADEVLGRHFSMFYTAADRASDHATHELREAALEGHYSEEGWRVRRDGSMFWARVTITSLRDQDGVLIGFGKVTHDLTERMLATSEIAASEKRLRLLIEGSGDGFILRDHTSGEVLYANQAVARLSGLSDSLLRKGGGRELLAEADLQVLSARLHDPGPWEVDVHAALPVGDRVLRIRAVDLSPAGAPLSALVVEDITLRHTTEQRLAESEERFSQLLASQTDAYVVMETDPLVALYGSPSVRPVIGVDADGLARGELARFVHPDDLPGVQRAWQESTATGYEVEFRLLREGTSLAWIRLRVWPIRMADGRAVRVGAVFEDITERKRVESELRAAHLRADRANATKNDFLSRMSHELRTPLNSVLGFAQLLAVEELTVEQSEAVATILRSGQHLLGLINDVLDISRIENGRLDLSTEPVDVGDVVEQAVRVVSPMARDAGVGIRWDSGAEAWPVAMADRQRLLQILLNLLTNAIKYNRADGWVEVRSWSNEDEVSVAVADSGIGITDADLPRLFLPFERLGASSTGVEGAGVGLALSQQLAQLMGGRVTARSEFGKGSIFTVALPPATERAVPHQSVLRAPTAGLGRGAGPVGSLSVVSIEDNEANRQLLQRIVALRPQWRLLQAATGREGLGLVETDPPDLVLLDLHLPDMAGTEVLARILAEPSRRDLPVIVVSADATSSTRTRLSAAGAADYLTKPLDIHEVLDVLDARASAVADAGR